MEKLLGHHATSSRLLCSCSLETKEIHCRKSDIEEICWSAKNDFEAIVGANPPGCDKEMLHSPFYSLLQ
jgi:hypothetical protein